jgi:hypothetical protein
MRPSCVSGFIDKCGFLVCLRTQFPAVVGAQIFGCVLKLMHGNTGGFRINISALGVP